MRRFRKKLLYRLVTWRLPEYDWVKCNADGASKGNPSNISYGFCIRNINEDVIYAEARFIGQATNIVAEATTKISSIW